MGIDVGTSSSKGLITNLKGEVLGEHAVEHCLEIPRPGWAEQDADAVWWRDVCLIANSLMDRIRGLNGDLIGVACSAIGPTMLPLDRNGSPLRRSILYGIDTRATAEIEELTDALGAERIYQVTGQKLTSQSVGPKVLWYKRHEPANYERTAKIVTASTYLVYRLTGEFVVDNYTAPSFSPFFNLERLSWESELVESICPVAWLPDPKWAADIAGFVTSRAAEETGLPVGLPVAVGTVDAAAEALSAGVTDPGDLMVMYGTTLFLIQVLDSYRRHRDLWASVYCLSGRAVLAAGMATAGALINWFRQEFGRVEHDESSRIGMDAYGSLSMAAARVPPGSDALITLPYFSGERTPINDPYARGLILGLTLKHSRGHIYRSFLEAVGYGLRHNVEAMIDVGARPRRLVAVGGGTKNALWLQIGSDITGMAQEVPAQTVGAAYGDAYLAGLAAGVFQDTEPLRREWSKIEKVVEPDPRTATIYDELYDVYRRLYPLVRDEMHELARLSEQGHTLHTPLGESSGTEQEMRD
ncbi:MAG: FGGY-family carbohydrate kinase [Chloroflexota bacterium]